MLSWRPSSTHNRPHGAPWLDELNPAQRAAATYGAPTRRRGAGPLLIIAGAGTGKTNTLAHRVAHLVLNGVAPERILLLTFSRRASQEMIRRARRIVAKATGRRRGADKAPARRAADLGRNVSFGREPAAAPLRRAASGCSRRSA